MNKAKLFLAAIAVVCTVGGAFALKAKKASALPISYRPFEAGPGVCLFSYNLQPQQGGTLVFYQTDPITNDCSASGPYVVNL